MKLDCVVRTSADAQRCIRLGWAEALERRFVVVGDEATSGATPRPATPVVGVWSQVQAQWVLWGLLCVCLALAWLWPRRAAVAERARCLCHCEYFRLG